MYKLYNRYGTKIHTFRFNLEDYNLTYEIGKSNKLETLRQITNATAINWAVFDWANGKDGYGRRKSNGIVYSEHSINFPTFNLTNNKISLGANSDSIFESSYWRTLVLDGKVNITAVVDSNGSMKDARNGFAQMDNDDLMLIAVEGNDYYNKGTTDKELASFLCDLGAKIAFTNDGGGSVAMLVDGQYKYNQCRAIASALVVRKKGEDNMSDYWDKQARNFVKEFQSVMNLTVDGLAGSNTKAKIHELKNDKNKYDAIKKIIKG